MKIRAKSNRNIVDVDEPTAHRYVRAGLFDYVEEPPAADDLESKTKAELEGLAEGLDVKGTGKAGYVTKADLVKALSGRYKRRDMRAEG